MDQIARKVGDPNIPRPWSRYSKEKEKEKKAEAGNTISGQKDPTSEGIKTDRKNSRRNGEVDDPKLREFLQVMQSRSKSKLWADDVVVLSTVGENGLSSSMNKDEGKSVIKQDNGNVGAETDNTVQDQSAGKSRNLALEDVVSDMEYFKSRLKKAWSDSESDVENDSDENYEASAERHLDGRSDREVDSAVDGNGKVLRKEPLELSENQLTSSEKPSSSEGAADVSKTGRLFIRNLPYAATEEELDELFSKFGNVSEVHVVVDKDTKRSKGLAYVLFSSPKSAVSALEELDHSIFQGRLLHVIPAKAKNPTPNLETNDSGSHNKSFKQKREEERKSSEAGGKTQAWNSLFMRPDTVVEYMSRKYGVSKSDVLDREKDNLAVHIALGETEVINETKKALANAGVNVGILEEFASKKTEGMKRSKKIILVKNLPYSSTDTDLYDMFSKFGNLDKVIFPPTRTLALAVYVERAGARAAFSSLAYKRFRDAPLYLEWAPKGIISNSSASMVQTKSNLVVGEREVKKVLLARDVKGISDMDIDPERIESRSLFIKNLNFKTSDESLRKHLSENMKVGKILSTRIKKHMKNGKNVSMGFGFVEFDSVETAASVCHDLRGTVLDGHALILQHCHAKEEKKVLNKAESDQSSTKIIVRNVAFEATRKDLIQLFSSYGQIKSIRLPKKFQNHRGFAFVEFMTKQEAENALKALSNTHLYGRHLVLERAMEGETLEELRIRTAAQYAYLDNQNDSKLSKKRKRLSTLDENKV